MTYKVLNKLNRIFTKEEANIISKYIKEDVITEVSILDKTSFLNRLYIKEIVGINNNLIEKPIALLFNKKAKIGKLEIIENSELDKCTLIKSEFDENEKCCYIVDRIADKIKIREILIYIP